MRFKSTDDLGIGRTDVRQQAVVELQYPVLDQSCQEGGSGGAQGDHKQ